MISYAPFYSTMLKKGITEYNLVYKQGISSNTLHRMRHNKPITTRTLGELCFILDCRVEDVICYKEDEEEEEDEEDNLRAVGMG